MCAAHAPSFTVLATDEEQLEGATGTNIKRGGQNFSVPSGPTSLARGGSSAVMGALPEAGQTVPTMPSWGSPPHAWPDPQPVGTNRGNVCGSNVTTHGEEELFPDLFSEESEASLPSLGFVQALSDEGAEGRVAAEDWLEAAQAIDLSETDGAFG